MRKQNEIFKISVTYDDVTPESAEHGDFDDSGFEVEPYYGSLRDVLEHIDELGGFENFNPQGQHQSLYGYPSTVCYREARERSYGVHIDGPKRAMKRLNNIISKLK